MEKRCCVQVSFPLRIAICRSLAKLSSNICSLDMYAGLETKVGAQMQEQHDTYKPRVVRKIKFDLYR